MPKPSKCILVTPNWCVSPYTGGGQRTGIFFAALKKIAPTEVVVVGHAPDRAACERWFPGHAGLHLIQTDRPPHRRLGRLALTADRLRRFLWFAREYRPDPPIRDGIRRILGEAPAVIVYRYFPTFCWAGHGSGGDTGGIGAARICVDIDDSDDQKLMLAVREAFGSDRLTRLYRRLALPALRRLMRRRLSVVALTWFAAAEDMATLAGVPAAALPNVPFFAPDPARLPLPSAQRDVLFLGTYSYPPNLEAVRWFLRHCWPDLHRQHPQSRFRIVGYGGWGALAAEYPGIDGVDFVGAVDEVAAEYGRARLVVAPIFTGGGTKIKVIEACAFGRPVVATTHSARGFGAGIEAAIPQADTPEDFIRLCATCLADGAAADALGRRLQALQEAQFSRPAVEQRIAEQIAAAVAHRA